MLGSKDMKGNLTIGPQYHREENESLAGVSNLWPAGHRQLRMTMNVVQHKIINLLKILSGFLCLHVTMYLMCGPRQLFIFQCSPETPKGWTPLERNERDVIRVTHHLVQC